MKKIIRGKLYDTDTAQQLAETYNYFGDFSDYEEELYRKRTGEYFLHGKGGPTSRYAEPCGHGQSNGENIFPLSESEAREWAEANITAEEYISIFGKVEE